MWIKSRKPGLVRWFDFSDSAEAGKSNGTKPVTVPKNRWTHLAGTFESKTGVSRVYVDGNLLSERVGRKNKGLPQDFTAAGLGHKFGDEFIAFLDDVYMFDRVISPEEVKVLYKKCEFNRMVLHFGFQRVNTSRPTLQLQDQSGLENSASIAGGKPVLLLLLLLMMMMILLLLLLLLMMLMMMISLLLLLLLLMMWWWWWWWWWWFVCFSPIAGVLQRFLTSVKDYRDIS